ncbi:P-loop NTPase fold protein [Luteirhabdus pelagi]|uniref:P-loop NTPase fold protein n=1 Tax=Luteirhabdus pelagi TaxID=2792783 RepID=UPI001939C044|nr:P-loop NTPase fold protein [Luteirhabdus pelagi]
MSNDNYPKFISNIPTGEDSFSGGSHQKIATNVVKIIEGDLLDTKIIGLEGDWGSGKSNVVSMIQKQLSQEYYTFVFDAWGNQVDLTRKSFLEQLINELFAQELLSDTRNWKKKKAQLLGNSSKKIIQKYPKVKGYWIFIMLAFIMIGILHGLYEVALEENEIMKSLGNWKPIVSIYLLPIVLLVIGGWLMIEDYIFLRNENKGVKAVDKESRTETIGKMFYWFSGNDIESTETENIIEEEPSVLMFREYFSEIEKGISGKGKLLIVFDNLDRLDGSKVKALWSSIHTFFADSKYNFKSYIIIPYNREELVSHLGDGNSGIGFIEKSIPISFRVTPPIVTDWENFLNKKLIFSFGELISIDKRNELISIFDTLYGETVILPRKLINYVNSLVSLYLQWEDQIKADEIKVKYLALFSFTKNNILKDPYSVIPSRSYLKKVDNLFQNKEELDECIAALTFGVEKKQANEVLLLREFENNLKNGESVKLKEASKHSAFRNYFSRAYEAVDIKHKIYGLSAILKALTDALPTQIISYYWNDFAKNIVTLSSEFEEFNNNHKEILSHADPSNSRKVLAKFVEMISPGDSDESQVKYYKEIHSVDTFLNDEGIQSIDLLKMIEAHYFKPKIYLEFAAEIPDKLLKYKISCKESDLEEYLLDAEGESGITRIKTHLKSIKTIKKERELEFIEVYRNLHAKVENLGYNKPNELKDILSIFKELYDKPLDLKLSSNFYAQLSTSRLTKDDIYFDALCIALSEFQTARAHGSFQSLLQSLKENDITKISERIEWYISFGDLLKLVTTNVQASKYASLKGIANNLTANSYGVSRLNLDWVLKNFTKIIAKVFENNESRESKFVDRLNGWLSYFKTEIGGIDIKVFNHFDKSDNELMGEIKSKARDFIASLPKEDIYQSFLNEDRNFKILSRLIEIDSPPDFKAAFYSAVSDFFIGVAKNEISNMNLAFWERLIDKLDKKQLKTTFNSVRDILISDRGELKEDELVFLIDALLKYGNLESNTEGSALKIIIPLIKYDKTFPLFLKNYNTLIQVASKSKDHYQSVLSELETRYKSDSYLENEILAELAKKHNWDNDGE